jgi:FSR family fosmidomycin resistance protein-like MFS transporter
MTAGKYLSVFLMAGTAGGLAGGLIADRYGYRRFVLTSLGLSSIFLYLFFFTRGSWSLIFFAVAGMTLVSSHAVTMTIGQSFMPRNVGMASGLILGLSNGIGGITATLLGWVADHWGIPFTLQIVFMLPIFAFLTFLFIPYLPPPQAESWKPSLESATISSARQVDSSVKGGR